MPEMRDTVYGDIELNELEMKVLDTPDFQRLGKLYQLPTVRYVFHTATHTRFSQAIGTLEIADKIVQNIRKSASSPEGRLTELDIQYSRLAALLADIEDPPYYNVFYEDDDNRELIQNRLWEIKRNKLKHICDSVNDQSREKIDYDILLRIYSAKSSDDEYLYIKQIVDSEVGADRLDYLERDSRACGVSLGYVDSRILREFRKEGNEIVLTKNSIPKVHNIFHALFQMKYTIYDHEIARGVVRMLKESYQSYLMRKGREKGIYNLLDKDDTEFLTELEKTDNDKHIENLKKRNLIKRMYSIEAFTLVDLRFVDYFHNFGKFEQLGKELSEHLGFRVFVDPVPPKPLPATPIRVRINSQTVPLSESPLLKDWYSTNLKKQWKLFIFGYVEQGINRNEVENRLAKMFGCFQIGAYVEPYPRLDSLATMYKHLDLREKKQEVEFLKKKILELPQYQKKSLVELVKIGSASADEIAKTTGRSRAIESLYLNELAKLKLLSKERKSGKMIFTSSPLIIETLEEMGY